MINYTDPSTILGLIEIGKTHGIGAALYLLDKQHREERDGLHDSWADFMRTRQPMTPEQLHADDAHKRAKWDAQTAEQAKEHAAFRAQLVSAVNGNPPPDPRVTLVAIMAAHNLTRGDVARMLGLEPRPGGSHGTVDMWLSGARNIPASKLELIGIKAPNWKSRAPL